MNMNSVVSEIHLIRKQNWFLFRFYSENENDNLVDNIYLYIGVFAMFIALVFVIVIMIKKCIKSYKVDNQAKESMSWEINIVLFLQNISILIS